MPTITRTADDDLLPKIKQAALNAIVQILVKKRQASTNGRLRRGAVSKAVESLATSGVVISKVALYKRVGRALVPNPTKPPQAHPNNEVVIAQGDSQADMATQPSSYFSGIYPIYRPSIPKNANEPPQAHPTNEVVITQGGSQVDMATQPSSYLSGIYPIYRPSIPNNDIMPTMTRTTDNDDDATMATTKPRIIRNGPPDPRVQTTIEIMAKHPKLTVRAAMRQALFTDAESTDRKFQQRVRYRLKQLGSEKERSSSSAVNVNGDGDSNEEPSSDDDTAMATTKPPKIRNRLLDPRVQETIEIMAKNPKLTVRAAMRQALFTDAESKDRKSEKKIRYRLKQLGSEKERSSSSAGNHYGDGDSNEEPHMPGMRRAAHDVTAMVTIAPRIIRNGLLDPRVQTTIEILANNPNLTFPAAMRQAQFTEAEAKDSKRQMRIRYHFKKLCFKEGRSSSSAVNLNVDSDSESSTNSPDDEEPQPSNLVRLENECDDISDSGALATLANARAPRPRQKRRKETRPRKKYDNSFNFHPLTHANKDMHSLGGGIGMTIPRRASPELRAATKEYKSAKEEHTTAQSAADEARQALEEAKAKFEAAELTAQTAEDRYLTARSAVEKLDLKTETGTSKKWNEMYAQLKAYREEHGHVRIPTNCPPELAKLSNFTARMKQQHKSYVTGSTKTYKPHRLVLLEQLGVFVNQWQEKYNQLLEFKEEFGHCNVPTRSYKNVDERLKKLGYWVGWQRCAYKKHKDGRPNTLSAERIQMLEDVGFVFSVFEEKGIVRKRKYGKELELENNEEGHLEQVVEGDADGEQNEEEEAEEEVNEEEEGGEAGDSDDEDESQVIEQAEQQEEEEEGQGASDNDDY